VGNSTFSYVTDAHCAVQLLRSTFVSKFIPGRESAEPIDAFPMLLLMFVRKERVVHELVSNGSITCCVASMRDHAMEAAQAAAQS
jgi:hypothetical protein